ncbi:MAG TPA: hypothetical protein VKU01_33220 [Bryobacteraceae bacterium]|nr:hypothetical protein [Bryobacteraceae bacterium]
MKIRQLIATGVLAASLGFEAPMIAQPQIQPAVLTAQNGARFQPVVYHRRRRYHRRAVVVRRRPLHRSLAIVGGSAAGGAAIGALAGGGKGAAVGALVGGGAGYVYDRATHKKVIQR